MAAVVNGGRMGKKFFGQSGATMMEIMIALVVAAALAAIASPNWQKAADKKRADRALAALMTISECIKQYKVEYRLTSPYPAITYGNLEYAGCVSRGDYPTGFAFPASGVAVPMNGGSLTVSSSDGTRMVCVTDIGNLSASAPVYFLDAPSTSACASTSPYYRLISEDQICKQRGS